MRILVIGAGAVGGYFGGRLLQAGRDVTFLVRPGRAAQLARFGLVIKSPVGDVTLPSPPTVQAGALREPYDLILLSCKAYDLDPAVTAFAPAVGAGTAVLPLLNGLRHLDVLGRAFSAEKILGGQCVFAASVALDPEGAVVHSQPFAALTFGELRGGGSERARAILAELEGATFEVRASDTILLDMWEKWVMLSALAGATTLMRAAIGEICAAPGGRDFILGLLEECRGIATAGGYAPRPAFLEKTRAMLTTAGSTFTASMFRDIERKARIEADHVIGDHPMASNEQFESALAFSDSTLAEQKDANAVNVDENAVQLRLRSKAVVEHGVEGVDCSAGPRVGHKKGCAGGFRCRNERARWVAPP